MKSISVIHTTMILFMWVQQSERLTSGGGRNVFFSCCMLMGYAKETTFLQADMFAGPASSISKITIPHDLHRRRRAMFSSHFSVAAVHKLEPLLREKTEILFARLEDARKTGEPVPLWHAFSALAADIITSYSFPEGYNHLNTPDRTCTMSSTA
jgi:hypothetical protein